MKVLKTEIEGITIKEDFNSKGFYRLRILFKNMHLYVQMNPEQSSFPPWLKDHGLIKED